MAHYFPAALWLAGAVETTVLCPESCLVVGIFIAAGVWLIVKDTIPLPKARLR
jgi:hypothetical protein